MSLRRENLDHFQYRFQPVEFVNSVVLSPSETQPYIISQNVRTQPSADIFSFHMVKIYVKLKYAI